MTALPARPDALLAPFRGDPRASALLLDVDGTLAPIVADPAASRVPAATLDRLAQAVTRFGLVACVSGRRADDAARLVPVPGLVFAGNHGLELLDQGALEVVPDVDPYLPALRGLVRSLTAVAAAAEAWVEDKGATLSLHFREASDPDRARAALERGVLPLVEAAGLEARFGRMVLEVRPPVPVDKGTAVRRLLHGRGLRRALYAGDDRTDLDAFRVVDLAVAVRSPEAPAGLLEAADVVVDGTEGVVALLDALLGARSSP